MLCCHEIGQHKCNDVDGCCQVLHKFLEVFSQFDWDKYCLSLRGPIILSSFPDPQGKPAQLHDCLSWCITIGNHLLCIHLSNVEVGPSLPALLLPGTSNSVAPTAAAQTLASSVVLDQSVVKHRCSLTIAQPSARSCARQDVHRDHYVFERAPPCCSGGSTRGAEG